MEIKDLMVGDWVLDGTKIAQITSITCDGIIETNSNKTSNIELITAISLTEEILKKNGFNLLSKNIYVCYNSTADRYFRIRVCDMKNGEWELRIDKYEKFNNSQSILSFYSNFLKLHHLQHALRLCGIDKEINLLQTKK